MKTCSLALTLALSAFAITPALADEAPKNARSAGTTTTSSSTLGEGGAPSAQPPARKVCRSQAVTGTRVPGPRLCLTKAEWRALERGESVTILQNSTDTRRQ